MVRLDKFLCDCQMGSRSQVKDWIRAGLVTVNGAVVKRPERKLRENEDVVALRDQVCAPRGNVYYLMNKPAGVVSATVDNVSDTVLSLLRGVPTADLFPVGRLDKDTTGLLLITNDGELAHRLLSPRRHVEKTYLARCARPLTGEDLQRLEEGVDIGDEALTLPAKAALEEERLLRLTIREGRYHQVKRMLIAIGNEVLTLKRISMGPLILDPALAEGDYRELTEEEKRSLLCQERHL